MKKNRFALVLASIIMLTSSCVVFVPDKHPHHRRHVVVVSSTQSLKKNPLPDTAYFTENKPGTTICER